MTTDHLAHWRMHNLRLAGPRFEAPAQTVRWLGAVQSQDYGPAKWSVGERTDSVDDAALDRAFGDGSLLRTHLLRPTWHFVAPDDIRWILELTGPRVQAFNALYYRRQELDGATLARCNALLTSALQDGPRTRKVLQEVLAGADIATDGFRLALILMNAELDGLICSGPLAGKQHTYALLDQRAPEARRLSHDDALAELTLRYFTSHGPATAKDFGWWSSLRLAEIKKGLALAGDRLEHETIDGLTYWFAPSPAVPRPDSPRVHLLQGYDEYIVGYSESKHLLDASGAARVRTQDRAIYNGVLILDSQVAGHWKRTVKRDSLLVEVALYQPFDRQQTEALEAAAERQVRFLGLPFAAISSRLL